MRTVLFTAFALFAAIFTHRSVAAPPGSRSYSLYPQGLGDIKRSRGSLKRHSPNRNGTQYFLFTSAIPLDRGEGYFKNMMVTFNQAAIGVTKNFSLGAGVDLASVVTTRTEGPVWFARTQLSGSLSDMMHIGATAFYLNYPLPTAGDVPEELKTSGFGAVLGMFTFGNADNQVTVSGGWGHDGERATRGPILNVSGAYRAFPNVSFMTEHWILTDPEESFPLHMFGIRVIGDYLALDAGLAYDQEITSKITPIGLPFVAATLNFGQPRR